MATYNLTTGAPSKLQVGDIINVPYSGTYKSISLPPGTYKLEVWGARGGQVVLNSRNLAGRGGYSYGTLTLTDKTTTLYCYSGGAGSFNQATLGCPAGGFNGGGAGGYYYGSSGGGGSDIRINSTSLYARVIVAGGGGGPFYYSYVYSPGGNGGGVSGTTSADVYNTSCLAGAGTATAGGAGGTYASYQGSAGSFGSGGAASSYESTDNTAGGGGGGWYGGGGSSFRNYPSYNHRGGSGGGGGSGYVYTASTASNYPSGCLLNSSYYLSDAATINGSTSFTDPDGTTITGHNDNGYCRITVIDVKTSLNSYVKAYDFPSGYFFWESVAPSTTAQYLLKTSTIPTGKTKLKFKFKITATSKDSCLFCSRSIASGTDTTSNTLFLLQNGNFRRDYYGQYLESGINYVKAGDEVTVEIDGGKTWINGKLFTNFTDVTTQSPSALIFGGSYTYSNSTATYNTTHTASNCNFHFIKMYNDDGSEKTHYRPCKDGSDNLYIYNLTDKVAISLTTSAVTFLGEVINDWREVKGAYVKTERTYPNQVEYIETFGKGADSSELISIDTNISCWENDNMMIECTFALTDLSEECTIFGANDTAALSQWGLTLYHPSENESILVYLGMGNEAVASFEVSENEIIHYKGLFVDGYYIQSINGVVSNYNYTTPVLETSTLYLLGLHANVEQTTIKQQASYVRLYNFSIGILSNGSDSVYDIKYSWIPTLDEEGVPKLYIYEEFDDEPADEYYDWEYCNATYIGASENYVTGYKPVTDWGPRTSFNWNMGAGNILIIPDSHNIGTLANPKFVSDTPTGTVSYWVYDEGWEWFVCCGDKEDWLTGTITLEEAITTAFGPQSDYGFAISWMEPMTGFKIVQSFDGMRYGESYSYNSSLVYTWVPFVNGTQVNAANYSGFSCDPSQTAIDFVYMPIVPVFV